jgi:hypothetical protein
MKYIITESQYKIIRRREEMKKLVDDSLSLIGEQNNFDRVGWGGLPLSNLILIVVEYVSDKIASSSNLGGDEYITFRNQIKLYIRNNFYEYIKEFWDSKQ